VLKKKSQKDMTTERLADTRKVKQRRTRTGALRGGENSSGCEQGCHTRKRTEKDLENGKGFSGRPFAATQIDENVKKRHLKGLPG